MTCVTQSTIARLAGVSRSTVGRVINNCKDVNPETRQRVQALLEEYGYRPNLAGQALVTQQKNFKIGCIIIQSDNAFFDQLNEGILQKAEEFKQYGIGVLLRSVPFEAEQQLKQIDSLLSEGICALVIQPTIDEAVYNKLVSLNENGIPVVTVNTDIAGFEPLFCYVGNDFYTCGQTAANLMRLFTGGKCNIGIVTGFSKARSHVDRVNGFRDYIKQYPDMQIIDIAESQDNEMEAYYVTRIMLQKYPQIDAMFLVAGGVYGAGNAIKSESSESGRQIQTISFDDIPTTRDLVRKGIISATICQQPVRQGRMSMSVLYDYLVEGRPPATNRLFTDIQIKLAANIDMS